jgi:hypothetical protein
MTRNRRLRSAVAFTTASLLILLHACGQEPTEPPGFTPGDTYQLTIGTGSSSASGVVTSNRGGIECSVTGATAGAAASGICTGTFAAGTVVSVTATAVGGAVLKLDAEWGATCTPLVEAPQVCQITMDRDRAVAATFVPAPTTFTLTIAGGASGSGTVYSTPTGISCTIVDGEAVSGNCSAGFPRGTSVKLTANAASGRGIKAWAGGQCEVSAEGGWKSVASCVTAMSRNVHVVISFEAPAAAVEAGTLGEWTAPFAWPAVAIHAALLPNRQVMTYGRHHRQPVLWNPASPGSFTSLPLPADFFCSGLTLLRSGRLLLAGGHAGVDNFGLKSAYQFNHATRQWIRSADMRNGRWYPTLTTLPTGQILAISGGDTSAALNRIPELFLPGQNRWKALPGAARDVPYYPMMFVAPDGKVFLAGPEQSTAFLTTTGSGSWAAGPTRRFGYRDYGSAVMYDVGKIMVVGGGGTPTATAEVIDLLGSRVWDFTGSMSIARRQINATLLADGTVLVTGGTNASGFNNAPTSSEVLAAEQWDPASPGSWKKLARMSHYRLYHTTALLLPDGRVLVAGSGEPAATGLSDDLTAEIFSPPYLFKADGTPATRPVISSVPVKLAYGATFTVRTANAAQIGKVMLVRLPAVTHAFDMNQRGVRLSFSAGSGSLTVTAPMNTRLAPPGHYMLFIVNSSGVPSVAKVVKLP